MNHSPKEINCWKVLMWILWKLLPLIGKAFVYMCLYMCMCVYMCILMCICKCMHVCVCLSRYICVQVEFNKWIRSVVEKSYANALKVATSDRYSFCIYVCIYVYVYECMCILICSCKCMHVCVYLCSSRI